MFQLSECHFSHTVHPWRVTWDTKKSTNWKVQKQSNLHFLGFMWYNCPGCIALKFHKLKVKAENCEAQMMKLDHSLLGQVKIAVFMYRWNHVRPEDWKSKKCWDRLVFVPKLSESCSFQKIHLAVIAIACTYLDRGRKKVSVFRFCFRYVGLHIGFIFLHSFTASPKALCIDQLQTKTHGFKTWGDQEERKQFG